MSEDRQPRDQRFDWSQLLGGELQSEDRAVGFCLYMIREYESWWQRRKPWFRILAGGAFVFAAATPVLIAADAPDVVSAIPVAAATAIAGILAVTGWQDGIARSGHTAEALKCELLRFRTRAKPYDGGNPLEEFVKRLVELRMTEVDGWRTAFTSPRPTPNGDR